ncbi:MAG: hypothetical protein M1820_006375 [Bogoriella megaspora]|nr:MAG: hypothetical protein M1820_006375 [Bogoriella megaspora]
MYLPALVARAITAVDIPSALGEVSKAFSTNPGSGAVLLYNGAPFPMHVSWDWCIGTAVLSSQPTDYVLEPYATSFFELPSSIQGLGHAFYVSRTPNPEIAGPKRTHDTKMEFLMRGHGGHMYFDVDVEKGVSIPMIATDLFGPMKSGCGVDKLATCPEQWKHYGSDGLPDQCLNWQTSDSIGYFRDSCPGWYVMWNDEETRGVPSFGMNRPVLLVAAGGDVDANLENLRAQTLAAVGSMVY